MAAAKKNMHQQHLLKKVQKNDAQAAISITYR
jgi:hypothetical protein